MNPTPETNLEKFLNVYRDQLAKAVHEHPSQYGYGPSEVPTVFLRMKSAIERGTYNHSGDAFKNTCKVLGITHNRKSIEEFIRS